MTYTRRLHDLVADRLPPRARRRAGRLKRALLDLPEPVAQRPAHRPQGGRGKRTSIAPAATASMPEGMTRLDLRRRNVLSGAAPSARILEIGPAHNGTLPRRDGFDTRNLDYLDREGLVQKYAAFEQYDPADIEEVDYVLEAGATYSEVIDERFDVVLASHVLEHSISLIDFLNECAAITTPAGHVALVVPDHRFCFDRFRPRSSLSRVIDQHLSPPPVHTPGTLAEFTLNAVRHRGTGSWRPGHAGKYSFIHDLERAKANMAAAHGPTYIDVHNWIFSPHHLRLLLADLADLGFIELRETHFHPTVGHEFFLNLSVEGKGPELSRQELVTLADEELRTLDAPTWATPPDAP